jgi:DNA-binding CsgD family transcriptional regulator
MITKIEFEGIYPRKLTPTQHKVLDLFLQGKSDQEIKEALGMNNDSSVRHHIPNICKLFGLKNEEGEGYSYRDDLIDIFVRYMPEMVNPEIIEGRKPNPPDLESPDESPVPLDSPFYVEPFDLESKCYQKIERPGALLRIKGSKKMGKTSLLLRILDHVKNKPYQTVCFNFMDAESALLSDIGLFLRWFCQNVCDQLNLDSQWIKSLDFSQPGIISTCKAKFQTEVLEKITNPIVLVLEELDLIFPYDEVATNFLTMLRSWNEESKKMKVWKNLRILLLYSTDCYVKLPVYQSPFNVGFTLELTELAPQAVQDLASRHQLRWNDEHREKLMAMIGGYPYLIRVAFHHLASQEMTLEQLLETAATDEGVYRRYLQSHRATLETNSTLKDAFKQVVIADNPVKLSQLPEFQLVSMGLVKQKTNGVIPSCQLYRDYFRDKFQDF